MTEREGSQALELPPPGEYDPILGIAVDTINNQAIGYSVPYTFVVAGQLISGKVISGHEFWTLSQEAGPLNPADAKQYAEDAPLPSFVHLREARYLMGGMTLANDPVEHGLLVRIRIRDISAWSAGLFDGRQPSA